MNLRKRVLFALGISRSSAASDESGAVQQLQLSSFLGEVQDPVPSVQLFGFASVPQPGCDHVVAYAEGDRSKGIAIGSNDQRYRPKGMLGGEAQIYDGATQFIYLKAGTKVVLNAVNEIDFQIGGTIVGKFTAAGLTITGDITATGNIIGGYGGSDAVQMQGHTHTYTPGDGTPTQTSAPVAGT